MTKYIPNKHHIRLKKRFEDSEFSFLTCPKCGRLRYYLRGTRRDNVTATTWDCFEVTQCECGEKLAVLSKGQLQALVAALDPGLIPDDFLGELLEQLEKEGLL